MKGLLEYKETEEDFGRQYKFEDGNDNSVILDLVEFTLDEFLLLSAEEKNFETYNIISDYNVVDIIGFDWDVEIRGGNPNVRSVFRTIEHIGKTYVGIHYPSIIYYDYDNIKMHFQYRNWIEFMGYDIIHDEDGTVIYFREKTK